MQKRNEHIRRINVLIDKIISEPTLHVKWLNTLSYLEHTGSRKIHKSNFGPYLNLEILSHACEEARHAYSFKKFIQKVDPEKKDINYDFKNLLAGFSSFKYFQKLDLEVYKYIKSKLDLNDKYYLTFVVYLYVTYTIEERANMVFHIYNQFLEKTSYRISLKGIIKEEEKHMKVIYSILEKQDFNYELFLKDLSNIETQLFDQYLTRLEKVVFHSNEDSILVH